MSDDYRNTEYCNKLENVLEKKQELQSAILEKHKRAKDMHNYVKQEYKQEFMIIYNFKCAYCGVSLKEIPINQFEIDHYKCKDSFPSKKEAGFMENLVLSCYDCNRGKGKFLLNHEDDLYLHPDTNIQNVYYRDDQLYIKINEDFLTDDKAKKLYDKCKLYSEKRRLDYILMSLRGMISALDDSTSKYKELARIIDMLQTKRNVMMT